MEEREKAKQKASFLGISLNDYSDCPNQWSLRNNVVFIIGIVIRIYFLSIGMNDHDDKSGMVKYTDIDYFVFTDAAYYVLQGGSPYDRTTYRYTPIFAYIVFPNHWIHPMFGKILFSVMDMVVIVLIRKIIQTQLSYAFCVRYQNLLDCWVSINPFLFITSTRGSNDIIVGFFVLSCLLLLIKRYYVIAGAFFGLSVHLKIYPIIYGFPLIIFIERKRGVRNRMAVLFNPMNWFTKTKLKFFGTSAVVFFVLFGLFYKLYGYNFVYESYIYHSLRVDHRHNFSFNYFFEYFHFDELPDTKYLVRKLGFVAQWGLVSFVGIRYYYDLTSAIALQTFIFVIYNRVVTAQYFLWYAILLPLVAIKCKPLLSLINMIKMFLVFFTSEMMVNLACLALEVYGIPSFDYIFLANHQFLLVNCVLVYLLLVKTDFSETNYEGEAFDNVYPEQFTVKIPIKESKAKAE